MHSAKVDTHGLRLQRELGVYVERRIDLIVGIERIAAIVVEQVVRQVLRQDLFKRR